MTGKCVKSDRSNVSVCEVYAWCPVELDVTPMRQFKPSLQ
jgi:P2X purinoceptor 4